MNFKEWVKSEEFKNIYKNMTSEMRKVVRHQIPKCGSNGSGNHFWEIQKDEVGNIWIMIHSGSRKMGHYIAEYYNNKAIELNELWHTQVPKHHQLAFLPLNTKEGKEYIKYMNFACTFAKYNHEVMLEKTKESIREIFENCAFPLHYYIRHNYAAMENHFGENVMVHRKGATKATKGLVGIIPGSQGTYSYIVEGLGNKESFESCSHGAGRLMGRNVARNTLNMEDELKKLNDKGIVHSIRNQKDLDEAPGSYKDIQVVMENQKDLVKVLVKLEPLGVVKG